MYYDFSREMSTVRILSLEASIPCTVKGMLISVANVYIADI